MDNRPLIFVFGAMRDKAISEMTEILFPLAERVIATRPENPRAASPEEIQQAASRMGTEIERLLKLGKLWSGLATGRRPRRLLWSRVRSIWLAK